MRSGLQLVEKVCFFKKSACSQSLSPLGHSVGFASCKAWCVLISASLPKTPSPWEGAILLGLPPLDPVGGYAPATPFLYNQEVYRQSDSPDLAVGAVCSYLAFIRSLSALGKIYPERYLKDIVACRDCDISVCDCQRVAFV